MTPHIDIPLTPMLKILRLLEQENAIWLTGTAAESMLVPMEEGNLTRVPMPAPAKVR